VRIRHSLVLRHPVLLRSKKSSVFRMSWHPIRVHKMTSQYFAMSLCETHMCSQNDIAVFLRRKKNSVWYSEGKRKTRNPNHASFHTYYLYSSSVSSLLSASFFTVWKETYICTPNIYTKWYRSIPPSRQGKKTCLFSHMSNVFIFSILPIISIILYCFKRDLYLYTQLHLAVFLWRRGKNFMSLFT